MKQVFILLAILPVMVLFNNCGQGLSSLSPSQLQQVAMDKIVNTPQIWTENKKMISGQKLSFYVNPDLYSEATQINWQHTLDHSKRCDVLKSDSVYNYVLRCRTAGYLRVSLSVDQGGQEVILQTNQQVADGSVVAKSSFFDSFMNPTELLMNKDGSAGNGLFGMLGGLFGDGFGGSMFDLESMLGDVMKSMPGAAPTTQFVVDGNKDGGVELHQSIGDLIPADIMSQLPGEAQIAADSVEIGDAMIVCDHIDSKLGMIKMIIDLEGICSQAFSGELSEEEILAIIGKIYNLVPSDIKNQIPSDLMDSVLAGDWEAIDGQQVEGLLDQVQSNPDLMAITGKEAFEMADGEELLRKFDLQGLEKEYAKEMNMPASQLIDEAMEMPQIQNLLENELSSTPLGIAQFPFSNLFN